MPAPELSRAIAAGTHGALAAERLARSGLARALRRRVADPSEPLAAPTAPSSLATAFRATAGAVPDTSQGWRPRITGGELRQPDETTCGASSLVMIQLINNAAYRATFVNDDGTMDRPSFVSEVMAMRRRTSGFVDHAGRLQWPWLPALGTGPWAVARAMSGSTGAGRGDTLYRVLAFDPIHPVDALECVQAAVARGEVVPLFVGTRAMARHIVAVTGATGAGLEYYDPADGEWHTVAGQDLVTGRAVIAGWREPWFAVVPAASRRKPSRSN